MPIYEYRCQSCGHQLEKLQKISDAPLTDCPDCGKPDLTKLISAAGFRLKGGGWYETDFKKDNKRNLAGEAQKSGKSDDASGGKSDNKSDKKSDSGSGAKTDTKRAEKSSNGKVA